MSDSYFISIDRVLFGAKFNDSMKKKGLVLAIVLLRDGDSSKRIGLVG